MLKKIHEILAVQADPGHSAKWLRPISSPLPELVLLDAMAMVTMAPVLAPRKCTPFGTVVEDWMTCVLKTMHLTRKYARRWTTIPRKIDGRRCTLPVESLLHELEGNATMTECKQMIVLFDLRVRHPTMVIVWICLWHCAWDLGQEFVVGLGLPFVCCLPEPDVAMICEEDPAANWVHVMPLNDRPCFLPSLSDGSCFFVRVTP